MSETHSSTQRAPLPPGIPNDARQADVPFSTPKTMPVTGDQLTVISSHPPLPAHGISDSTHRIMEGRIMPGDHLGHFELLDYVGGGGMGRVFRAFDTRLARIVALKVLSPEQAADAETVQRFQNEAQSAARLDHENIARAHYVGEDRGIHFIAFEFVEGVNIRVLVEQRGPLPLAEAVSYTLQVADALAHANERNVVHRDIKPSNIIITPEGRVKLIDMGLARLRQVDPAVADLTASGVTLGTFDYISPEQARDPRNADIRSDIYSLGCTVYFMLTGRPPFLEGTVLQKLLQHQSEQPPDVREFRPDLPEEADRILQKMLAKEPKNRYRDPGELAVDLLAIAERLGLQPLLPSSRVWLSPADVLPTFWHRHLPWMASVTALVVIVLALDFFGKNDVPSEILQNSTSVTEEVFVPALPPPANHASPTSPAKRPDKDKRPPKNGVMEEPESDLPTSPLSKGEQKADGSVSRGVEKQARTSSNLDTLGGYNSPSGFSSTAESYFRGNTLDDRQPLAGKMTIGSGHRVFPLDAFDFTTASSGTPPMSTAGPLTNRMEASSKTGASLASADSTPKKNGVLVVNDVVNGINQFASLSAACAAAQNGDVIELRYNGRREEKPLRLANSRLTIRAAEGFSPILVFRPNKSDPVKCPRGMFTLGSGRLVLANVAVELIVPRDIPAEYWTLFEIRGGQTVRLDRCALTINNAADQASAYRADATFFRVLPASETDSTVGIAVRSALPLTTLELNDSLARGEAAFLRIDAFQPMHLTWNNGLLITSEQLLYSAGGMEESKSEDMLQVNLRHVTAIVRGGLCRFASTSLTPSQLAVQFNGTDSIFLCSPGVPLIQQEGSGTLDNLRRQIVWNGNLNFYDQIDVFWSIRRLDGDTPPDLMNFGSWQSYWGPSRENQPMPGRVYWKSLPGDRLPTHLQSQADYELNENRIENPALGAASDGYDVGVQADRLLPLSNGTP